MTEPGTDPFPPSIETPTAQLDEAVARLAGALVRETELTAALRKIEADNARLRDERDAILADSTINSDQRDKYEALCARVLVGKASQQDAVDAIRQLCRDNERLALRCSDAHALPAVQPDAAAIREAALAEALAALYWAKANLQSLAAQCRQEGATFPMVDRAIQSALDVFYNPGKEVMPDEARTTRAAHDIGPGDQAVAGAAHPPAVPFGAQPGTKIVFHGIGGYEAENEKARSVLQVGSTYTLLELDVGGWRSSLSIKEAPGMWFNTVMFQPEPVAGAAQDGDVEREIEALRLKAFRTNAPSDREAYFMATSKWFQDRHYRYMAAPDTVETYQEAARRLLKGDSHE
jgi:hypothetical protein